MKHIAKSIIVAILGWQVRRLRSKNDIKIVGVVGSIGKTSTKFAISRVLGKTKKVRFQEGNYNDIVSVPLIFFGQQLPPLFNIFSWVRLILANELQLIKKYPYDIVVAEIGTDGKGQIELFGQYLFCDIAVVTAITPEHMEFFADLDEVASEELAIAKYSDILLINNDLCEFKYYKMLDNKIYTYGESPKSGYRLSGVKFDEKSAKFSLKKSDFVIDLELAAVSKAELYSASAATIIASIIGIDHDDIKKGVKSLKPVAGRMQRLDGIKNSLIIDETYNASPVAVKAALDSLYAMNAPQKIAILGNMNELGHVSEQEHRDLGDYCEPNQLDLVVTIGKDANKYTAEHAKQKGCKVATFDNPYEAGEFVRNRLKIGAIILAKGSQNGVYAEEAVKLLLKNSDDEKLLVRQSTDWLKTKHRNFGE